MQSYYATFETMYRWTAKDENSFESVPVCIYDGIESICVIMKISLGDRADGVSSG